MQQRNTNPPPLIKGTQDGSCILSHLPRRGLLDSCLSWKHEFLLPVQSIPKLIVKIWRFVWLLHPSPSLPRMLSEASGSALKISLLLLQCLKLWTRGIRSGDDTYIGIFIIGLNSYTWRWLKMYIILGGGELVRTLSTWKLLVGGNFLFVLLG